MRLTGFALAFAGVASQAGASMAPSQWYHGRWNCSIDGRPSTMVWKVVSDPQTECSGGVCSQSSGVRTVGWFKDGKGPWVRLVHHRSSDVGLAILYNNVDPWVLNRKRPDFASGHTTWNGGRYPLSCRKVGNA